MKKKVCHLTSVHRAKDTRIYYKECRALAEHGYDVKLIVVNSSDINSDYKSLEIINVDVKYRYKLDRILKTPFAILAVALRQNADIYHFHDPELLTIARKLKSTGASVVYDSHEDVPSQIHHKSWIPRPLRFVFSWLFLRFEHKVVRNIDAVVTVVEPIAQRFRSVNENVVVLKNYPILDLNPAKDDWSQRDAVACYVGDLTEVRGVKTMVKALKGLNFKLVLGGRFESKELADETRSFEGWSNVDERGFIDRQTVRKVYAGSKVGLVVLHPTPSYIEALPVKLLEYMAAGLAVIGSDFGLIKSIVEEHKCGILVDPLNPIEIGEAITRLLTHDDLAKKMGENGRNAAHKYFSWHAEQGKLLNLYNQLSKAR